MISFVGIELVIAMLGILSFRSVWPDLPRPTATRALWFAGLLLLASVVRAGAPGALMAFKVALFAASLAYARWHPSAALRWLVGIACLQLVLAVGAGTFATKLASLPILLFAALWATETRAAPADIAAVLALAVAGEAAQAAWLSSRGGAFVVIATALLWLAPARNAARGLALTAALLPWVYPLVLTLILASMFAGLDLVDPTASNVERSMMSAWCVEHAADFLIPGPGGALYEADTVDLSEALSGRALDGFLDPHSFLLSAWVWLGTLPALALQIVWATTWWRVAMKPDHAFDARARPYFVVGAIAVVSYTLSPPDTFTRLTVALEAGIALAGISGASARPHPRLPFMGRSEAEAHDNTAAVTV